MDHKHGMPVGKGKIVETEYTRLHTMELNFYPENPRISSILNSAVKRSNEEIHNLMQEGQSEAVKELFRRIQKDGQISEPLIAFQFNF